MSADVVVDLKSRYIDYFDKLRLNLYKGIAVDYTILKYLTCVINDSDYYDDNLGQLLITYV